MLEKLQQQNFKEIIQKMSYVSGWEILEQEDFLALKSPVPAPLVNMVWGEVTENTYSKIMDFYGSTEFYWLLDHAQVNNIPDKLRHLFMKQGEESKFPEMVFNLQNYVPPLIISEINTIIPKSQSELQIWTDTAIVTLGIKETDFQRFFYPLIDIASCIPLLLYYNSKPAGTAMVYCGDQVAGIYAMSTKEEFRRKKIGSTAVHACLKIAQSYNLEYAVLYASNLGMKLYDAVGFEAVQYFYEFNFNSKNQ
jgi:hypothetical protein